ncbi:UPF0764 protein C16orf89 homolog [Tachypleus tridentatus]|uniref:UPF0764 protein C16orf89 homolog n=1 Tax=Tachypleus tridentatus TaxID=6853 RepID=UPI003FD2F25D
MFIVTVNTSRWNTVFLGLLIFTLDIAPLFGSVQNRQLTDTLNAVNKALRFIEGSLSHLNLDGVIGIRMVDDQLQVFLARRTEKLHCSSNIQLIWNKLSTLQKRAQHLADSAIRYVRISQPEYYQKIGRLLRRGQWALVKPTRYIRPDLQEFPLSSLTVKLTETESDECLQEILGSKGPYPKPCDISQRCWNLMTSRGYDSYALTHEVFYLEIGEMCDCKNQMALLARRFSQGNFSHLLDLFCSNVFRDAERIEDNGFPLRWRDLLMEQVALCGVAGFRDFYRPKWVKLILSWQHPNGCYGYLPKQSEVNDTVLAAGKIKREEHHMGGSCLAHMTSVALGALVVNARFLLEDLMILN